jgi:hypothetical protein
MLDLNKDSSPLNGLGKARAMDLKVDKIEINKNTATILVTAKINVNGQIIKCSV